MNSLEQHFHHDVYLTSNTILENLKGMRIVQRNWGICTVQSTDFRLFLDSIRCREAQEILNSYAPRTGTAYYFTEKGNQLREMPTYEADIEKEKKKRKMSTQ